MIELGIVDLYGEIRPRTFLRDDISELKDGFGFDGSSVRLAPIESSDLVAIPDTSSSPRIYELGNETILFYFCYIYKRGGNGLEPHTLDVRRWTKDYLERYPYTVTVGPEIEFYLYLPSEKHESNNNYMCPYPLDRDKPLIWKFMRKLDSLGYNVKLEHSEVGEGQHEITIGADKAFNMCDKITFFKYFGRIFFAERGREVTFSPKPFEDLNGSGCHLHISLRRPDGTSVSFVNDDEGRSFLAGILKYIPEITLFLNPSEESYKRLVPGFEAPVYISWGVGNRTALIRIPNYRESDEYRFELRSPDPTMNPYLGIPLILEAGLRGVKEELELEEEANGNVYIDPKYRKRTLPPLKEAVRLAEESELVKNLGEPFIEFISLKKEEIENKQQKKFNEQNQKKVR